MTYEKHIEILQQDVMDWKKRALKAERELCQMAIAYEELQQALKRIEAQSHDRFATDVAQDALEVLT